MALLLEIAARGCHTRSPGPPEAEAEGGPGAVQECIRLLEEDLEKLDPRLLPYHEKGLRRAIRLLRTAAPL